jgi:AcrR family transcriptional regulator
MIKPSPRDRLAQAASALFNERGYEQTTVDDITERAGVGRTTFFRYYRSKEDVIFPDHDRLLAQISERLRVARHDTALAAVSDAVRLVLLHYLDEGDLARRRYKLTSSVPALRDREIATVARYQRLFREFIAGQVSDTLPRAGPGRPAERAQRAQLRAELMAASVVAAHNHVLRRWLRGESLDPMRELDEAMHQVSGLFTPPARSAGRRIPDGPGTTIVAFRADADIDAIVPALRRISQDQPPRKGLP